MDTNYNFILLSSQKIILIERDDGRKKQVMEKKATVSARLSRESLSVPMASAVLCWTMAHMCNIHIGHS